MINYHAILEPNKYYHVYNHAVGDLNLFSNEGNFNFFLQKYTQFIYPIADTFAYCLMPNHFHLAIKIKSIKEISELRNSPVFHKLDTLSNENFLSKQFSNLFSSYTQAYNKQQQRRGNLFEKNFRRKLITDDEYYKQIIHYIHFNPVHHKFVNDLRDWKYSSFDSYLSDKSSKIKREEVMNWFGDKENFLAFHCKKIDNMMALELE